ncbi:hypothetical protein AF335_10120 [Streptomyces eurocidicus]|uniref:Uncharacterized protein n=1 Tax=Streptomyces eurocidicus TaxID=66423 RepID=A0A2N8NWZ7_STREU|nr:HEAT repeat domain-containing protein [Streptomyces eurocidicus]MBB5117916.1 hypothetical protein [Streptomyces eurocidicus]MBF6053898.1 hypothetical protein [Streptomyces eurocidicus]PNE33272.1 hypothetical protein AF335_10120 [Streptomyces eurocidicus]
MTEQKEQKEQTEQTEQTDGVRLLLAAVDAYDSKFADGLMSGMSPDEVNGVVAEDGRSLLLRAVDRGAYSLVERILDRGGDVRLTDADGRDALALATYWHGTGVEAELRRRTGATGPVERVKTEEDSMGSTTEFTLGGRTVRDGHSAIVTLLEPVYGITRTFGELLARALAEPDVDHSVWWAATFEAASPGPAVWDTAAALRDRPDPRERYFGAEILRSVVIGERLNEVSEDDEDPYDGLLVDLFLPWLAEETDPRVVRSLTAGLANARDPRAEEPLPALARHPDAGTRRWALSGLSYLVTGGRPEAVAAVVECLRDEDPTVRQAACAAFVWTRAASPAVKDALAERLTDEDLDVRVMAAVRLGLLDDPRGDEVVAGLDEVEETDRYRWGLLDLWSHQRARANSSMRTP